MLAETALVRAFDVGLRLNVSTQTVINLAKKGKLPGAVIVGNHVRFDPDAIEEFIKAGARKALNEQQPEFAIVRHGGRDHAGNLPRNDRTRRSADDRLSELVKQDPGIGSFEPVEVQNLDQVEGRRYLKDARTPGLGEQFMKPFAE